MGNVNECDKIHELNKHELNERSLKDIKHYYHEGQSSDTEPKRIEKRPSLILLQTLVWRSILFIKFSVIDAFHSFKFTAIKCQQENGK